MRRGQQGLVLTALCAFVGACNALAGITDGVLSVQDSSAPADAADDGRNASADGGSQDGTLEGSPGDAQTDRADAAPDVTAEACAMTTCGTVCTDTSNDPNNCGNCSRSCLGGACSDGGCEPVLVTGSPAEFIAVDSTSVYWTSYSRVTNVGTVHSCSKTECDGGTTLYTQNTSGMENNVYGIAISADAGPSLVIVGAYFGNILTIPSAGGTATTLGSNLMPGAFPSVAYDPIGGAVYAAGGSNAYVLPLDGGTCDAACSPWIVGLQFASSIAVDTQRVYVTSNVAASPDGGGSVAMTGLYQPLVAHNPNPKLILDQLGNPSSVYSDGNYVWTAVEGTAPSFTDGEILSCPVGQTCAGTTPPPTPAATSQYQPMSVVSDGTNVYWANLGGGLTGHGQIMACKISSSGGCSAAPIVVAGNLDSPGSLAQDASAVYWVDLGGIEKIAKPAF